MGSGTVDLCTSWRLSRQKKYHRPRGVGRKGVSLSRQSQYTTPSRQFDATPRPVHMLRVRRSSEANGTVGTQTRASPALVFASAGNLSSRHRRTLSGLGKGFFGKSQRFTSGALYVRRFGTRPAPRSPFELRESCRKRKLKTPARERVGRAFLFSPRARSGRREKSPSPAPPQISGFENEMALAASPERAKKKPRGSAHVTWTPPRSRKRHSPGRVL